MGKPDFGKKLIEVRRAKGLTQEEVAEKCKITVRTVQRIESGTVTPRAFTIKIISETLGFDFFETSNTGYEVFTENQNSNLKNHKVLWYLKDLFNLKTNAMRKISILSGTSFLAIFLFVSILNLNAQNDDVKSQKSLLIERNDDNSVKRVEAAFTRDLTLDSLVHMKQELQNIGITIHYKKIEFDVHNLLSAIDCQVISNDGFSGSFGIGDISKLDRNDRFGFYRDYTPDCESPFGTGLLDKRKLQ